MVIARIIAGLWLLIVVEDKVANRLVRQEKLATLLQYYQEYRCDTNATIDELVGQGAPWVNGNKTYWVCSLSAELIPGANTTNVPNIDAAGVLVKWCTRPALELERRGYTQPGYDDAQ